MKDSPLEIVMHGDYVDGIKIRKTNETPPRVSVIDLIKAIMCCSSKYASEVLALKSKDYKEVSEKIGHLKFEGKGQQTPVTDVQGVVTIINLLPGEKAAMFRLKSADIIVRYLGGDTSLIGSFFFKIFFLYALLYV